MGGRQDEWLNKWLDELGVLDDRWIGGYLDD